MSSTPCSDPAWPAEPDHRRGRILIGLLLAAAYILLATTSSLWDQDEPRFARATVEMLRSGDLLVPTFNGAVRPDKPILIYWLMALPVSLFGATSLALRSVSLLAAGLAGWLTWRMGRRLGAGWSPLLLWSSPMLLALGTACTADAVLLAGILGVLATFHAELHRPGGWPGLLALLAGAGAGLLVKGPVALVPTLLVAVVVCLWLRHDPLVRRATWRLGLACLLGLAALAAWAIPADLATQGAILGKGLGRHVVERSLTPLEGHGSRNPLFLFFYVPVLLVACLPWLPPLLAGLVLGAAGERRDRIFLLAWLGTVLVVFSLVMTKLPHYVLPAVPALALVAGWGLHRPEARAARLMRMSGMAVSALAGLAGPGLVVAAWLGPVPGLVTPVIVLAVVWVAAQGLAWHWYSASRPGPAVLAGLAGLAGAALVAATLVMPVIEALKPGRQLALQVRPLGPDRPLAMWGFEEPSFVFTVDRPLARPVEGLAGSRNPPSGDPQAQAVVAWLRAHPRGLLAVDDRYYQRIVAILPSGTTTLGTCRGFKHTSGRWVDLRILGTP